MQWYLVILIWSYLNSSYRTSLVAQTVKCLPAMRETWVRSLGREDPMEKKMATHPSTLAWKIPWTKEPDRLQSMGLQRFGYGWATSLSLNSSRCWASFHFLFAIVMCLLALLLFFAKESVQFCSFLSLSFLLVCKSLYMCVCAQSLSHVWLFAIPWSFQVPLSMGFPGKDTGLSCHILLQGIFLTQGSNPPLLCLLHWQGDSLPLVPPGKPKSLYIV